MKPFRKFWFAAGAVALACSGVPLSEVAAQSYPNRTVTVVARSAPAASPTVLLACSPTNWVPCGSNRLS